MGVMMQAFYWDCPEIEGKPFQWWGHVRGEVPRLAAAGFTALWLPPANKAADNTSMGYDPYDFWDLGEFDQKGSVATWFGTRAELENLIADAHVAKMQVYADYVIDHCSGADAKKPSPVNGVSRWTKFTPKSGKFPRDTNSFHPSRYETWDAMRFGGMPDLCHLNPYRLYGCSVGVDGPRRHQACQNEVVADLRQRRPSVEQISRIGMDTSKHIFQLHGVNAAEEPVLRKKLRRKEMFAFFEKLAPTVIAIEACGASHHYARLLQSFGHTVKLIAPQLVKPYIKRGKNDAADAEALCEAMSRPTMRFVPVKTAEQQAALMLVGVRDRLIRNRTQLTNAIRGYAGEFGLTAAKGKAHLDPLLERIQADESLPALARELFAAQAEEYAQLQAQIDEVDAKLMAWHRADECSQRLAKIPGVGPIGAVLLKMKTPEPGLFRSGRQFAAWIGLTPKDHSTAGKVRLGGITRAGDEGLRSVLVVGATAVIQHARARRKAVALAYRTPQTQVAEAGRRGTGQQDGAHRLETDGYRGKLRRKSAPAALAGAA